MAILQFHTSFESRLSQSRFAHGTRSTAIGFRQLDVPDPQRCALPALPCPDAVSRSVHPFSCRSVLLARSLCRRSAQRRSRHGQPRAAMGSSIGAKLAPCRVSLAAALSGRQDAVRPRRRNGDGEGGIAQVRAASREMVMGGLEGSSYTTRRPGGLRRCRNEACACTGGLRRRSRVVDPPRRARSAPLHTHTAVDAALLAALQRARRAEAWAAGGGDERQRMPRDAPGAGLAWRSAISL